MESDEPFLRFYDKKELICMGNYGDIIKYVLKEAFKENVNHPKVMAVKRMIGNSKLRELDMCRLIHKNIVTFFGVETIDYINYIKMEVANCNLKTFQKNTICAPCEKKIFRHLALQISEGIEYLHVNGVAHRDIKPHNILVFHSDKSETINNLMRSVVLKLCDFGLSRNLPEGSCTMTPVGTLAYLAPEVEFAWREKTLCNGDSKKADIYSCGMVFLELLLNRMPDRTECSEILDPLENTEILQSLEQDCLKLLSQMLHRMSNERIRASCLVVTLRSWHTNVTFSKNGEKRKRKFDGQEILLKESEQKMSGSRDVDTHSKHMEENSAQLDEQNLKISKKEIAELKFKCNMQKQKIAELREQCYKQQQQLIEFQTRLQPLLWDLRSSNPSHAIIFQMNTILSLMRSLPRFMSVVKTRISLLLKKFQLVNGYQMGSNMPSLSSYEKHGLIGSGSYGDVFRYDVKEDIKGIWNIPESVAVKRVISTSKLRVSYMCRLTHKNITKVYGAETIDDIIYVKMEVARCNLRMFQRDIVRDSIVGGNDLLHMALEIMEGVEYLHEHGIAHGNIKPNNILVFWSQDITDISNSISCVNLKLCDVSPTRADLEDSLSMTIVETPLAPEVRSAFYRNSPFRGDYKKVDIYFCGIVFTDIFRSEESQQPSHNCESVRNSVTNLLSEMLSRDSNNRPSAQNVVHFLLRQKMDEDEREVAQMEEKIRDQQRQIEINNTQYSNEMSML